MALSNAERQARWRVKHAAEREDEIASLRAEIARLRKGTTPARATATPHKASNGAVEVEQLRAENVKLRKALERANTRNEAEFRDRVSQEITRHFNEVVMPMYKEKLEKAERLMRVGKPFTNAEFTGVLLRALHPDSTDEQRRNDAFALLKSKEILLRPEEKDRPLSGGLPASFAELMARRRR